MFTITGILPVLRRGIIQMIAMVSCATNVIRNGMPQKLHCDRLLAGFSLLQMEQLRGLIAGLRCVVDGEDYYIESYCDPMFIASLVRGFWPPPKYQKQLLDDCLLRAHRKECFWFSDAVANVIPDCAEYRFVHCWLESVGHGGTSR